MLDAFTCLLCLKSCWHSWHKRNEMDDHQVKSKVTTSPRSYLLEGPSGQIELYRQHLSLSQCRTETLDFQHKSVYVLLLRQKLELVCVLRTISGSWERKMLETHLLYYCVIIVILLLAVIVHMHYMWPNFGKSTIWVHLMHEIFNLDMYLNT